MSEQGFTVISGQRLDTGLSGATPVVMRRPPGAAAAEVIHGGSGPGPRGSSRFTEHL